MISPELLQILCCPETKALLSLASESELLRLNERIQKGELQTQDGKPVTQNLEAALIREDQKIAYRIQNNIPILLVQEGIKI